MTKLAVFISYNSRWPLRNILALPWHVSALSPQYGKNTDFFSYFPLGGLHGWGILLVIPLELQGKRHQPFSMAQPILLLIPLEFQEIRHQPLPTAQPNFLPWGSPTSPPEKPNTLSPAVTSHQQTAIMGLFKRLCKYVFVSSPQYDEK